MAPTQQDQCTTTLTQSKASRTPHLTRTHRTWPIDRTNAYRTYTRIINLPHPIIKSANASQGSYHHHAFQRPQHHPHHAHSQSLPTNSYPYSPHTPLPNHQAFDARPSPAPQPTSVPYGSWPPSQPQHSSFAQSPMSNSPMNSPNTTPSGTVHQLPPSNYDNGPPPQHPSPRVQPVPSPLYQPTPKKVTMPKSALVPKVSENFQHKVSHSESRQEKPAYFLRNAAFSYQTWSSRSTPRLNAASSSHGSIPSTPIPQSKTLPTV